MKRLVARVFLGEIREELKNGPVAAFVGQDLFWQGARDFWNLRSARFRQGYTPATETFRFFDFAV